MGEAYIKKNYQKAKKTNDKDSNNKDADSDNKNIRNNNENSDKNKNLISGCFSSIAYCHPLFNISASNFLTSIAIFSS